MRCIVLAFLISLTALGARASAAVRFAAGLSPRSIQRRLSGARSFMDYLIREGHVKNNPVAGVAAPKASKRLPDALDPDQMAQLLDVKGDVIR